MDGFLQVAPILSSISSLSGSYGSSPKTKGIAQAKVAKPLIGTRSTSKILLAQLSRSTSSQKEGVIKQLATHLSGKIERELNIKKTKEQTTSKIVGYLLDAKRNFNRKELEKFNLIVKSSIRLEGRKGASASVAFDILNKLGLLEKAPPKHVSPYNDFIPERREPEIEYKEETENPIEVLKNVEKPVEEKPVEVKPADLGAAAAGVAPPLIVHPAPPLAVDTSISRDDFILLLNNNGINHLDDPVLTTDPPRFIVDYVFPPATLKLEFRDFVQVMNTTPENKRVMNDLLADKDFRLFKDPIELPLFIDTKITELRSHDAEIVGQAAKSLSILAFNPDSRAVIHRVPLVIETLQALLTDRNLENIKNAYEALSELWREKPESIKDSVTFLAIAAESFRSSTIRPLSRDERSHILVIGNGLAGLLNHADPQVRNVSLTALSSFANHTNVREDLYELIHTHLKPKMLVCEMINIIQEDMAYKGLNSGNSLAQVLEALAPQLDPQAYGMIPPKVSVTRSSGTYFYQPKTKIEIEVGDSQVQIVYKETSKQLKGTLRRDGDVLGTALKSY